MAEFPYGGAAVKYLAIADSIEAIILAEVWPEKEKRFTATLQGPLHPHGSTDTRLSDLVQAAARLRAKPIVSLRPGSSVLHGNPEGAGVTVPSKLINRRLGQKPAASRPESLPSARLIPISHPVAALTKTVLFGSAISARLGPKPRIVDERLKEHVRVEQQVLHQPCSKASSTASGVASKSGPMVIGPFSRPGCRGSRRGRWGTRFMHGLPARADDGLATFDAFRKFGALGLCLVHVDFHGR